MPPSFYATLPADQASRLEIPAGQPVMLTAASFERVSAARGRPGVLPMPKVPEWVSEIAIDPGGFVAATHGGYKFTWETYENWLHQLGPRLMWAAFADLPCEQELASDAYKVRWRQEQTLEWAWFLWGGQDEGEAYAWHRQQPWAWVPTVQGRNLHEYAWMARQMSEILTSQMFSYAQLAYGYDHQMTDSESAEETRAWAMRCAIQWRVGIGSLCQRKDIREVVRIVQEVHEILPGCMFHLWGVKVSALRELTRANLMPYIASFDTAAFNGAFGTGLEVRRQEMKSMNLSQRAHGLTVALPRYQRKVAGALAQRSLI